MLTSSPVVQVSDKFKAGDLDEEAQIGHSGVVAIARELGLQLSEEDLHHFVDINFRFVDTSGVGKIKIGQFLTCCAGLLYSYDMCQVRQPVFTCSLCSWAYMRHIVHYSLGERFEHAMNLCAWSSGCTKGCPARER